MKKSKWIDIKEKQPEEDVHIIGYGFMYNDEWEVMCVLHDGREFVRIDNYESVEITYWMPLPEKPEK